MEVAAIIIGFSVNIIVEQAKKKFPNIPTRVVLALLTIVVGLVYHTMKIIFPELAMSVAGFTGLTFTTAVASFEYLTKLVKE